MLRLYITKITALLSEEQQKRACAFLEEERRAHALSVTPKRSTESIAAGLLLAYAVWEHKQGLTENVSHCYKEVSVEEQFAALEMLSETEREQLLHNLQLEKKQNGKPYFRKADMPYVSLSHSGEYAVCAFSDKEVGVDIQEQKEKPFIQIAKRICHAKEPMPGNPADFYDLWAVKEACVKCTGEGLSKDFRELYIDWEKTQVLDERTERSFALYLSKECPRYSLAVAVYLNQKNDFVPDLPYGG